MNGPGMDLVVLSIFFLMLAVIYAIPTIVAFRRNHPNRWLILVINMAFGGTIIGWGVALVWALRAVHRPGSAGDGGESGLNIFVNDAKKVQIVDPSSPSAAHELERLHDLLTRGVISQAEFDGLKAKLIGA